MSDRAEQIIRSAVPVRPVDVGVYQRTEVADVSTQYVIAGADLAWLVEVAQYALRRRKE